MLESRASLASYMLVVSSQDIPNTNFWDEEIPNSLPLASLWPEALGHGLDMDGEENFSDAWQAFSNKIISVGLRRSV